MTSAGTAAPTDAEVAADAGSRPERSLLHYIGVALSIALLLSVIALAAITIVVPKLAGAVPLTVLTNSMSPGYPPGTLVIIRPVDTDEIEVGDIVTYQIESGKPGVITHRVIGFAGDTAEGEKQFITQGDNNASPDIDPIREVQIQGELWYGVPYLGFVNNTVNGENRGWIVGLIAGVLFAYAAWMVVAAVRDRVRRRRSGDAEEDAARSIDAEPQSDADAAADAPADAPADADAPDPADASAGSR